MRWDEVLRASGARHRRSSAKFLIDISLNTVLWVGVALLILAVFDYGLQRWKHEQDLRMTHQEVREEMKNLQGDPQIVARRRAIQRQMVLNRISSSVPKADVVVTNPTELAVAIQYDPEEMAAPVVVAKGAGVLAQRIRRLALEHNIPVVERKPLAQLLYKEVDIDKPIPTESYAAVAEVLAYVYQLKARRCRRRRGRRNYIAVCESVSHRRSLPPCDRRRAPPGCGPRFVANTLLLLGKRDFGADVPRVVLAIRRPITRLDRESPSERDRACLRRIGRSTTKHVMANVAHSARCCRRRVAPGSERAAGARSSASFGNAIRCNCVGQLPFFHEFQDIDRPAIRLAEIVPLRRWIWLNAISNLPNVVLARTSSSASPRPTEGPATAG